MTDPADDPCDGWLDVVCDFLPGVLLVVLQVRVHDGAELTAPQS